MVVAPVMTPRFGSVSPNLTLRSPTVCTSSSVREQLGSQKPYDGLDPQNQKDDDANTQNDVRGGNQPVPVTAFHAGGVEQPHKVRERKGKNRAPIAVQRSTRATGWPSTIRGIVGKVRRTRKER